jgi:Cytochrome C oxidase, cbb3-type, subunit III
MTITLKLGIDDNGIGVFPHGLASDPAADCGDSRNKIGRTKHDSQFSYGMRIEFIAYARPINCSESSAQETVTQCDSLNACFQGKGQLIKMSSNKIKSFAAALMALPILATFAINSVVAHPAEDVAASDPAATYVAKCKMCHGPKAEKFFDLAKKDEEMSEIILKGKKAEKPPNMPAFDSKGIDADQAKALVALMRTFRQ